MKNLFKKTIQTASMILAFMMLNFNAYSQWTTIPSTSNIYNTAGGNVLIGGTSFLGGYGTGKALELQSSGGSTIQLYCGVGSGTTGNLAISSSTTFGNSLVSGNLPLSFYINGSERFRVTTDGKVGIGTTTPANKLDIEGGAVIGATYSGTNTAPTNGLLVEGSLGLGLTSIPSTSLSGGYKFAVSGHSNLNGSVVIGTTSSFTASTPFPSGYKLYVADGILTEKVKVAVKSTTDWSDFVFADNYQLKPLEAVGAYIKEHRHLPDVPSAEEVVNNGVDMAKMDAVLLQKIEELTLYMLQMKEENEALKKEMQKLKEEITVQK